MDHLPSSNLEERRKKGGCCNLKDQVTMIAGWPTPRASEGSNESVESVMARRQRMREAGDTKTGSLMNLTQIATLAGWRSPATTEPGVSLDRLVTKDGEPWTPGQRAYDKITGRLAQVGLTHEAQAAMPIAGWPTPAARDVKGESGAGRQEKKGHPADTLANAASLAGWMTPTTTNMTRTEDGMEKRVAYRESIGRQYVPGNLGEQVDVMVGWATPRSCDGEKGSRSPEGCMKEMERKGRLDDLPSQAVHNVVGWATPGARDHKDTPGMSATGVNPDGSIRNRLDQLGRQVGLTVTPSSAETEKPAASLNSAFSRWLQGYPVEWCQAAIRASRAMPTRRAKRG